MLSAAQPIFSDAAAPSPRLAVARVTLQAFRNYGGLRLETDSRPVVLVGPNGAGKTNILEALSLLVPGRGLRRAAMAEVIQHGGPSAVWGVAVQLGTPTGDIEIGTGSDGSGEDRRTVQINGQPVRGQAVLADYVSMVWLTPDMDRILVESGSARRRFLDRLVTGFDPSHAGRLNRLDQAMRERLRLLKDGVRDDAWFTALEHTLATTGVAIAAARRDLVRRLNRASTGAISAFPDVALENIGEVEDWLDNGPALEAEDRLRQVLAAGRGADQAAGATLRGAHRSDLGAVHVPKNMPAALCSTGEQKALMVSLILSYIRLMQADRGHAPLVLLDDVAAHLDATRRDCLYEEILGLHCQAWLTGTDASLFTGLQADAQAFSVADGHINSLVF
jgi:DNA replication and repair protein RecF